MSRQDELISRVSSDKPDRPDRREATRLNLCLFPLHDSPETHVKDPQTLLPFNTESGTDLKARHGILVSNFFLQLNVSVRIPWFLFRGWRCLALDLCHHFDLSFWPCLLTQVTHTTLLLTRLCPCNHTHTCTHTHPRRLGRWALAVWRMGRGLTLPPPDPYFH